MMKKLLCMLLLLAMCLGTACADELPKMVKVEFAPVDYTAPEKPTNPPTGDSFPVAVVVMLMVLSVTGAAVIGKKGFAK